MPDSLESYAQEGGRAGRDGLPARVTLLFDPKDERVQRYFLIHKQPPAKSVTAFLNWLAAQRSELPLNLDGLKDIVPDRWCDVLCSDLGQFKRLERRGSMFVLSAPLQIESARLALQTKHAVRAAADRARLKRRNTPASAHAAARFSSATSVIHPRRNAATNATPVRSGVGASSTGARLRTASRPGKSQRDGK